jgi:hypothetical protein
MLRAICRMEDGTWSFGTDVKVVYGRARVATEDSLGLEIYFKEERPMLVLEVFFDAHKPSRYTHNP